MYAGLIPETRQWFETAATPFSDSREAAECEEAVCWPPGALESCPTGDDDSTPQGRCIRTTILIGSRNSIPRFKIEKNSRYLGSLERAQSLALVDADRQMKHPADPSSRPWISLASESPKRRSRSLQRAPRPGTIAGLTSTSNACASGDRSDTARFEVLSPRRVLSIEGRTNSRRPFVFTGFSARCQPGTVKKTAWV